MAARTLAAIDEEVHTRPWRRLHMDADRARVASDLAGWNRCQRVFDNSGAAHGLASDLQPVFADGLRRTARLYGVDA